MPIQLFAIFSLRLIISVKFCQFVADLYSDILTNFGWFNLIFNKMALTFLGVPTVFTISSFEFMKSNCCDFIASDELPQFTWPQFTRSSGNVLSQAATEARNKWMNEWMNLFTWQKNKTISQPGTPRHDNVVRLPVFWVTIIGLRVTNNYVVKADYE